MTNHQFCGVLATWLFLISPTYAQRDLKDIPSPDPELERATLTVPEGFEVNLYAADPLIAKPIHMNFDAQGRLWIASSEVYPQIAPGQPATDKILTLEDANGDGVADKTSAELFSDPPNTSRMTGSGHAKLLELRYIELRVSSDRRGWRFMSINCP